VLKTIALSATVLLLGGCALPVPFQIASWALDGISVLTTQKSITDHGISLVAEKDCAVWRGIVDGELCRDDTDSHILVADDEPKPEIGMGFAGGVRDQGDVRSQNTVRAVAATNVKTASNQQIITERRRAGIKFSNAMANTAQVNPMQNGPRQMSSITPSAERVAVELPEPQLEIQTAQLTTWSPPAEPEFIDRSPKSGVYFVIGSFRDQHNAARLLDRHRKLAATMISARIGGTKIFRVVVGPVEQKDIKSAHQDLRHAGIPDTWAMRVKPEDWIMTERKSVPTSGRGGEIARLNE